MSGNPGFLFSGNKNCVLLCFLFIICTFIHSGIVIYKVNSYDTDAEEEMLLCFLPHGPFQMQLRTGVLSFFFCTISGLFLHNSSS